MIPVLSVMIGAYIITRMLELVASDKHTIVKTAAAITILVSVFCVMFILNAGASLGSLR